MVTAKWARRVLLEDIRANNDISRKTLNTLLWNRFKVQMATNTLYRVRARALIEIHGGYDDSYAFLPGYCEMIRRTNPGSDASCVWNPETHVDRPLAFVTIFISFKPCLDGLRDGIRGFIGVDGTHLKGNYGGVLLSFVALDGNNELFPFAWGIVSNEDSESWGFFVHHLRDFLRSTGRGDDWCIISDRQKGIECALDKVWPEVDRRYCTKHLASNWKKAFPGPLMLSLFWKACGAYSEFTFKKAMEKMDKVGKGVLEEIPWSDWLQEGKRVRSGPGLTYVQTLCKEFKSFVRTQGLVIPIYLLLVSLKSLRGSHTFLYKAAYANGIKSILDPEQWPEFNMPKMLPPELKRGIGRPCRNRKRYDTEERKGKRVKTVRTARHTARLAASQPQPTRLTKLGAVCTFASQPRQL
ncbi:Protein FAR1-RELATED SEQUENCE 6 [Bienertia sinuspersici]